VAAETKTATKETPGKHLSGVKMCSSRKLTPPAAHLKCLDTNAHSMGHKQQELKATMLLESYDLVAFTGTWRDESYDWSMPIDG